MGDAWNNNEDKLMEPRIIENIIDPGNGYEYQYMRLKPTGAIHTSFGNFEKLMVIALDELVKISLPPNIVFKVNEVTEIPIITIKFK